MAGTLRDLKLWQEAVALAGEVVRLARQGARRETKALTDHMILTAVSVAEYIADGYARYTTPEQRQLYRAAKRALLRVETQLAVARHAELITAAVHADLVARVQVVQRLLGGYLVYLERQIEETAGKT
jgi:four helix bundle protein